MRDGFRFLLATADEPLTLEYICKMNEYLSRNESLEWGKLRKGNVGVGGTDFVLEIPVKEKVEEKIKELNELKGKEKALEYFCYAVKSQLFWDGNKRTSTLIANKILISEGEGVLTIDKHLANEFNENLLEYYNTDNKENLKQCLEKGIKTLERELEIEI